MIPLLMASSIIFYGIIQLIVALIAVILAVKWNKPEFLPGLFFLLLYTIIEVIDLFFFTIINNIFIDVAQFGFILVAIMFFIVGMHLPGLRSWYSGRGREIPCRNPPAMNL